MTISREHRNGPYVVQCDGCLDTEELEGTEFSEAVKDSKERGFKAIFRGAWQHFCKPCTLDGEV